jgi:hypothetical protein
MQTMFLTGKRIGRYYLQSLIEQGGMGDIYLAMDTHLHRRVAFKVMSTAINAQTDTVAINEAVNLFKREANAVALLDYPHILPLYDYGEEMFEGILLTYIVCPIARKVRLRTGSVNATSRAISRCTKPRIF